MNGTECSSATPSACDKNHRESGVFTPREDGHRVSTGAVSDVPIRLLLLTPGRSQASGVGVVSAQSSDRNGTKDSSSERAVKVSGRSPGGCISVSLVSKACIAYSKDKVFMGKGHLVHFVDAHCEMNSEVNKSLIEKNLLNIEDLRKENSKPGEVLTFIRNGRYVFSLVVKNKQDDKINLNIVSEVVQALKNTMLTLDVKSVKVSSVGNDLENLSWSTVEQIFKENFSNSGLSIIVCSGEIIIPPANQREEIIKEFHESVVGGHKGASKTYWKVRSNYFWENMKSDVQIIVKSCKNCQRNKLVRQGTRQPMLITDTPKQPFEKIQIDMVGPLPVTP